MNDRNMRRKLSERCAFRSILVVDDQDYLAWAIKDLLEYEGHDVVVEYSGDDALRRVEVDPRQFDAVVCDYAMPGMNGMDVLRRVREIAPGIRTILMSGHPILLHGGESRLPGVDAVLIKPFATDELEAQLMSPVGSPT